LWKDTAKVGEEGDNVDEGWRGERICMKMKNAESIFDTRRTEEVA
jgi:hypothetical protein